ncbi:MAG: phosphopentomutase [Actinomycetota bacterium]|nr:phosphopentomutase [Actinomycetota bacterium]
MAEKHIGRRAFVVVIDACGIGALPDAARYGDEGANTLVHLAEAAGGLVLPTFEALGLGSIASIEGVAPALDPVLHGRLHALGAGKDSTAGHWELMGVVSEIAPPTYPQGFPPEVIDHVVAAAGRAVICNRPYNGIDAIEHFGAEHLETGALIVYTSQDSVLQIAAHVDVVPVENLYAICAHMREEMSGEHAVGRVIARPFAGAPGAFARTDGRHDYSLPPPGRSYLVELREAGVPVHSVGKVGELFSGEGIDVRHPGATNAWALAETTELIRSLEEGLVFTNLVETDQLYGHRHDVEGFHQALRKIDASVGEWLALLGAEDLLVLTADHGCDPAASHTDHTREHAPLLAVFPDHGGARHDGPLADVGASALRWLTGREAQNLPGDRFV